MSEIKLLNNALRQSNREVKRLQKASAKAKKQLNRLHVKLYDCPMPEGKEEIEKFFNDLRDRPADELYKAQTDKVKQQTARTKIVYDVLASIVPIALSIALVGFMFVINPSHHPDKLIIGVSIALLGLSVAFNKKVQRTIVIFVSNHVNNKYTKVYNEASEEVDKQHSYRQKLIEQFCNERDSYFDLLKRLTDTMSKCVSLNDELISLLNKSMEE